MGDGALSPDELDSLLKGDVYANLSDEEINASKNVFKHISKKQEESLSQLLQQSISLKIVKQNLVSLTDIRSYFSGKAVLIRSNFIQGIVGKHEYLIPEELVLIILELILDTSDIVLDDTNKVSLQNIFSDFVSNTGSLLSNETNVSILINTIESIIFDNLLLLTLDNDAYIGIEYEIIINEIKKGHFLELYSIGAIKELIKNYTGEKNMSDTLEPNEVDAADETTAAAENTETLSDDNVAKIATQNDSNAEIQSVQFSSFQNANTGSPGNQNMGLLMDVYMEMTVELGRTRRLVKDILAMGEGTVIELDKIAGEPVDILVNHKLIARGEVVVIDENFGVRVTEIVSLSDSYEVAG